MVIYTKKYYKKDLYEKNENFILFKEMTSLALELEERLKNNTYDLYENINDLTISFKKDDGKKQIKQFDIRVPIRENEDNNILMFKLFSYIKALDEKVKILEKENKEIKKENEEIKKELNTVFTEFKNPLIINLR